MVDVTVSSLSSCLTLTGGLSNVFALFNYYYVCITLCVLVCVYNFPGTCKLTQQILAGTVPV